MLAADMLRAARARIADPKNWTQGALARDSNGREAPEASEKAVCWCARGAYYAEDFSSFYGGEEMLDLAAMELFDSYVENVNDYRQHSDVLALYDRAIELAEQAQ